MNKLERMKEIMKASPNFGKGADYKMCVVDELHDMKELENIIRNQEETLRVTLLEEEKKSRKIAELERQLAISEHDREHNDYELTEVYKKVEELERENEELKDDNKVMADNYSKMEQKFYDNLTKAKELLNDFLLIAKVEHLKDRYETVDEAEQFLKEIEQ